MGSWSPVRFADLAEETENEEEVPSGGIKYDEWDFRRGNYKRRWCSLYEHDIHPGREPFVELTLRRYGGYVNLLRKKFELLQREPKMAKRQKEGDHVDIDAVIEACSGHIYPGVLVFDSTRFLSFIFPLADVILITLLFMSRKTSVYGFLLNGIIVIYGTVFMAHYSIAEIAAKSVPANEWLLKSTLPDIGIAWGDFFIGKALYDSYMKG